ncbi:MAG TPA: amphi-Trp domain-containing protein [Mycobacteriales bacterium]|jgi:amphi-Trp domain-containing protein
MPDVEIKRKVRLSRAEAGRRLIALGKALTEGSKSEMDFDGDSIQYVVADHLEWEFELEVDGNETELEIEMKWTDAPAVKSPTKSPSKKSPRKASPKKAGRAKTTKGRARS